MLGLVYLDTQSDEPPLTYRDLQILTVLANVTATKIESARLLEEDLHKRRLEEDMRLAAQIQCHLLPRRAPEIAGYSVDGMTEPCLMVGGDYSISNTMVSTFTWPWRTCRARASAQPC